jgi:hypothetical protein
MRCSWNDKEEATEFGACAIAILVILDLTDYTVISRAAKGGGFDYWLGKEENDEELPSYQNKARLEVSGILRGNDSDIQSRVRKKLKQVEPSDDTTLPAYIVVVEFSKPLSLVVKK